jgi:hypothetical protein
LRIGQFFVSSAKLCIKWFTTICSLTSNKTSIIIYTTVNCVLVCAVTHIRSSCDQ